MNKIIRKSAGYCWKVKNAIFPKENPWVDKTRNELHGYRCYNGSITKIQIVEAQPTQALSKDILQPAGYVLIDGKTFDLTQEGVYRFYRLPDIAEQRVVCKDDALSILKMIGYLWKYGKRDDLLSSEQILASVKNRTLFCGCHNLSVLAIHILKSAGISARLVAAMSQSPWGGQDDGHTLTEIMIDGRFIAYDPSFNILFEKNGVLQSLLDLTIHGFDGVRLTRLPGQAGAGEFSTSSYDYSFWVEERFLSEDSLMNWYRRVLDVPLIHDDKYYYPDGAVRPENHERFSEFYTPMTSKDFLRQFYGGSDEA